MHAYIVKERESVCVYVYVYVCEWVTNTMYTYTISNNTSTAVCPSPSLIVGLASRSTVKKLNNSRISTNESASSVSSVVEVAMEVVVVYVCV